MDQAPQFEYRRRRLNLNRAVTAGLLFAALIVIMFPLLIRVRARLVDRTCAANLAQIGKALHLYTADNNDRYPAGVDASDKALPQLWASQPKKAEMVKRFPLIHEPLGLYVSNKDVFRCPLDTGGYVMENTYSSGMTAFLSAPTMYQNFGFSYLYRTDITFRSLSQKGYWPPANVAILFDGYGHWHGRTEPIQLNMDFRRIAGTIDGLRYNALFGDGHAQLLTFNELQATWNERL